MWPLLLMALTIIILGLKKSYELFLPKKVLKPPFNTLGIDAILLWSIIAGSTGFLSFFYGFSIACGVLKEANDISPAIVLDGLFQALISVIFGLFILFAGLIIWFLLRTRYTKLLENHL